AMIILSTNVNHYMFSYFRYLGVLITLYIIYVIIRARTHKREGAGVFIICLLIIFLAVVNDSLHNMRIIRTTDLLPLGMFLFLFLQTYILSSRFTKSFAKTEELTEELTYINKNLEKIVEERTREITYQKKEIEEKNEELSQLLEEVTSQRDEIEAQRDIVSSQKDHIETIHLELSQSIDYAKRIQSSILSDVSILSSNFSDYFVLFRPRDKVSGDFYWWREVEGHLLITVADCTGHGVPGGFMSMLGISFLREIIVKEYITHPGVVLRRLRKEIINVMKQKGASGEQKDGMDMALISINIETKHMQFSGANNPLYIIRDGELIEYKGDKMPIAIYEKMDKFNTTELQLMPGDQLYMFSDGYADQFGGPTPGGKKFKYKSFKELLVKYNQAEMTEQKAALEKIFDDWRGEIEQIDDVVVLGIKI
ncbi:MAG: SpoIIE family protein phosphatase, partial [Bacteroidota bacterium]